MAAMEQALTELTAKVEALRAASPPLLAPVTEAATIFKVSVPTMSRWVRIGHVPVVKVANTVRVDLSRVRGVDAEHRQIGQGGTRATLMTVQRNRESIRCPGYFWSG